MLRVLTSLLLALGFGAAARGGEQTGHRHATVIVFAAASLTDCLKEIAAGYEKETGDKVVFNLAASSTLARQIQAGARADIFFSADEAKMQALEDAGLIAKGTRRSRLSNSLVIVVAAERGAEVKSPQDLAGPRIKRLALADPEAVPAGVYAREYLRGLRLWSAVQPKVVPMENVRAALAAVEAGNAEAGIVYKTDAAISRKVRIAWKTPRQEGPAISYPMALLADAPQPDAGRRFLEHLGSRQAEAVFRKFGFIILGSPVP
ncbi:MAG: molybdate ABC transporter substrate-binding protein [Limisphaerales bacterium]